MSSQDHQAFARLVNKYQSGLRHYMRRLTAGDHHGAEDLAQDTFLMVYTKLHQYKSTGSFKSWLYTIAYRLFLDRLQKLKTVSYEQLMPTPPLAHNPMDADIYAEQLMRLLKPKERALLTLAYVEGMSHQEIEKITQLPLGSIKSYIHRAKQKLQQAVIQAEETQSNR
ncbi:RNA polymerase sigma factor [Marinicella sp. W31]|uniref:RNA polymerase sigma factor n=1 Tax=Marinicella sp. W31 TaxID=3023713 RepID=UPI003756C71D